MQPSLNALGFAFLFCASCASAPTTQLAVQDAGGTPAVTPEMQSAVRDLAKPGPEHELLGKLAGDWKVTMKMWGAPGLPPLECVVDTQSEMVLGGRFLQSQTSGKLELPGMSIPIESLGMLGFDRRNDVFTTVGFDTMGTYYVTAAGPQDPETGVITMSGSDHDGAADVTQTYKFVLRMTDDDHFVIDLYFTNPEMTHGQDEFHMLEMSYARASR